MAGDHAAPIVFWDEHGRTQARFVLQRASDVSPRAYRLRERFLYDKGDGTGYVVPDDLDTFVTDLSSVPVAFTWLVPRDGAHTPAALLHDAMIGGAEYLSAAYRPPADPEGEWTTLPPDERELVDDREADALFRTTMGQLGVSPLRRWLMWAAVSLRSLTKQGGVQGVRFTLLFFLLLALFGGFGLVVTFDLVDVPIHLWGLGPLSPLGERSGWDELGTAALWWVVAMLASSLLWGREWRVNAVAGSALSVLAFPLVASAVAWAVAAGVDAVLWLLFSRRRYAAPRTVAALGDAVGPVGRTIDALPEPKTGSG